MAVMVVIVAGARSIPLAHRHFAHHHSDVSALCTLCYLYMHTLWLHSSQPYFHCVERKKYQWKAGGGMGCRAPNPCTCSS